MTTTTAPDPAAADPLLGATPAEQADTLTGVLFAVAADCTAHGLRPVSLTVAARDGLHLPSAAVQFEGGNTGAVDVLGDAYRLPPAGLDEHLHDRAGVVVVDGRDVWLSLFCARPHTPALPVVAERADAPLAVEA